MSTSLQTLLKRARDAQADLEAELTRRRDAIGGHIERGRMVFDEAVMRRHRGARQKFGEYVRGIRIPTVVTAPIIYSIIIAFVLMDVMVTFYMWTCFPVYGIPKVRRRDYIAIDRHMLGYLNLVQKFNCLYCGYGNGVIAYAREVAGQTEAYWCPIKHSRRTAGHHDHYPMFMEYGDDEDFLDKWENIRRDVTGKDHVGFY